MFFKNLCVLVLRTKVASAFKGINDFTTECSFDSHWYMGHWCAWFMFFKYYSWVFLPAGAGRRQEWGRLMQELNVCTVIDFSFLFCAVLAMRHWQMSGWLVQELNVCTVIVFSFLFCAMLAMRHWQMSGWLVQELNVCTVIVFSFLFCAMLAMRHWQMSGWLVQELNVCTVIVFSFLFCAELAMRILWDSSSLPLHLRSV